MSLPEPTVPTGQDAADGLALRLLAEALPGSTITITPPWTRRDTGEELLAIGVEKRMPHRIGRSFFIRRWGEGPTIAAAARACRKALGGG